MLPFVDGPDKTLIAAIRRALRAHADPERGVQQRAYMKSALPCLGVPVPRVRALTHALCKKHPIEDYATWRDTVRELFMMARAREERYAALGIAGYPAYRRFHTPRALSLYRALIPEGAWWDLVDEMASRVSEILCAAPEKVAPTLRAWARDDNLWLRRTAILAPVGMKRETDLALLEDCIAPSLSAPDFFLRKAIGWALRSVAWWNPDWTVRYVRRNAKALSPLSKREALKNLLKDGTVDALP